MITRIRYTKVDNGFLRSTRAIPTSTGEVFVKFNPSSMVVLIVNGDDRVVDTFVGKSNHDMKKEIKNRLLKMGTVFEKETRIHKEKDNALDTSNN